MHALTSGCPCEMSVADDIAGRLHSRACSHLSPLDAVHRVPFGTLLAVARPATCFRDSRAIALESTCTKSMSDSAQKGTR